MPSIAQLSGKTDITTTTTPSKYLPRWLTLKKKKRKEKRLAGAAAASHPCLLAANPGPLANVTVTLLYFTLLYFVIAHGDMDRLFCDLLE